jgi:myo-inositol-1(or 4)-monophosphatase
MGSSWWPITNPLRSRSMTDDLLGLAVTAALAAGRLLRERFRAPQTDIATKSSPTDMVTDADRSAEALIVEGIRSERPDDSILGEESGEAFGPSGLRWVIDPLDGTTNFLFGVPHWAVSIACEDASGPFAGVVFDPLRDELFTAHRNGGATLNGGPLGVSDTTDISRALIGTGFSYQPEERAAGAALLPMILPRVRDIRRAGAASLDLVWVAAGRLDGFYESGLAPWDRAAGALIASEAGARVESMPALGVSGEGVIVAGPGIFDELRELIVRAVSESQAATQGR